MAEQLTLGDAWATNAQLGMAVGEGQGGVVSLVDLDDLKARQERRTFEVQGQQAFPSADRTGG